VVFLEDDDVAAVVELPCGRAPGAVVGEVLELDVVAVRCPESRLEFALPARDGLVAA